LANRESDQGKQGGKNTKDKLKIGVLASGRGTNLQAIIDACERGEVNARVVIVISDKKDAYALKRAENHKIEAIFIDPLAFPSTKAYEEKLACELSKRKVELVCLAGYMRILSSYFVDRFRWRIMNIHPALLPSFPGLRAQKQALEYGVKITGCTVHFVDEYVDKGPIIIQAAVPVFDDDDEKTLSSRILECEHKIYPKAIQLFAEKKLKIKGRKVYINCPSTPSWSVINPPL